MFFCRLKRHSVDFCGVTGKFSVSQTYWNSLYIRCMCRVRSVDQSTRWSILMMRPYLWFCTIFFPRFHAHAHIISLKTRAIDSEMIHNGCVISTFAVKFCYAYVILFLNGFTTINNSVLVFCSIFAQNTRARVDCEKKIVFHSNYGVWMLCQCFFKTQLFIYWFKTTTMTSIRWVFVSADSTVIDTIHRHIEQIRMNVIAHKIWQQR